MAALGGKAFGLPRANLRTGRIGHTGLASHTPYEISDAPARRRHLATTQSAMCICFRRLLAYGKRQLRCTWSGASDGKGRRFSYEATPPTHFRFHLWRQMDVALTPVRWPTSNRIGSAIPLSYCQSDGGPSVRSFATASRSERLCVPTGAYSTGGGEFSSTGSCPSAVSGTRRAGSEHLHPPERSDQPSGLHSMRLPSWQMIAPLLYLPGPYRHVAPTKPSVPSSVFSRTILGVRCHRRE